MPKNASGVRDPVVMLTTVPLLAGALAGIAGSAVTRGVRRLLDAGARFPEDSYVVVLGMHPAIAVVMKELEDAGDAVVWFGRRRRTLQLEVGRMTSRHRDQRPCRRRCSRRIRRTATSFLMMKPMWGNLSLDASPVPSVEYAALSKLRAA